MRLLFSTWVLAMVVACAANNSLVSHYHPLTEQLLDQLPSYHVTRPQQVLSALQSGDHRGYAPSVQYEFEVSDGQSVRVELEKNTKLFAPEFEEVVFNGETVSSRRRPNLDEYNCHYHGHVTGDENSKVAISTCSGLFGVLHTAGDTYYIQPIATDPSTINTAACTPETTSPQLTAAASPRSACAHQRDHVVYRVADVPRKRTRCGTRHEEMQHVDEEHTHTTQSSAAATSDATELAQAHKYIELLAVNDAAELALWGNDVDQTNQHSASLINQVSLVYANNTLTPRLEVVLTNMATFTRDPYQAARYNGHEYDSNQLLNVFQRWRQSQLADFPNDNAQLLSGFDFDDDVIGLSNVYSMCSSFRSASVNEVRMLSSYFDAMTIAHEMGHSLSMLHDGVDNRCDPVEFVMAGYATDVIPNVFSECSKHELKNWLSNSGHASCLGNRPSGQ